VYLYFLPLVFGIYTMGKVYVTSRFFHVYMMVGLIVTGAFFKIIFESVFPCKPENSYAEWTVYSIIYLGTSLCNYVIFTWLFIWHRTYITTLQESELDLLCDKEFGDEADSDEVRQEKFQNAVDTLLNTTETQWSRFKIGYKVLLFFSVANDLFNMVWTIINEDANTVEGEASQCFGLFINLIAAILVFRSFNKLANLLNKNPKVKINKNMVWVNRFICFGLVVFGLGLDPTEVNGADVGANIFTILIEMTILVFCWNLSTPLP
jgi:hypothetical protein